MVPPHPDARLASTRNLSQAELALALGIPERTLARRKREGAPNSEESSIGIRIFGRSQSAGLRWPRPTCA